MKTGLEKPGVQTPWVYINQLLTADERFEVKKGGWQGYLLAPKSAARLSALAYLLQENQMPYCIQGRGTTCADLAWVEQICLSTRALTHIQWMEDSVVAIEAGCDLPTMHSTLWQEKKEIECEGKGSLGGTIIKGLQSGVILRGLSMRRRLLGIELIKSDGGLLKLGSALKGAVAGPPLHQLFWGIGSLPAIITKAFFLTESLPEVRLHLSWVFMDRHKLWSLLRDLQHWTNTWERVDCVIPACQQERCFLLAQISGSNAEMSQFKSLCPHFEQAQLGDKVPILAQFILQKGIKSVWVEGQAMAHQMESGEYYWFHALINQGWLRTRRELCHRPCPIDLKWKKDLFSIL